VTPVEVDFPLRGEWCATNTPAERVPSHGTNYFGQRYAFDFVRMDETNTWFYPGEARQLLRHYTRGIPASVFYCWDEPVHAAFAGRVAAVGDGWPDRKTVQALWEVVRVTFIPPANTAADHRPLAGNYVILEGEGVFAFYGHLRSGSVVVSPGQQLSSGEHIGNVGNSGNSTMPHLHFHLMDGVDPLTANGVPCAFCGYERWSGERWEPVTAGMPRPLERIRAGSTTASAPR
jgi:hypothetical protein